MACLFEISKAITQNMRGIGNQLIKGEQTFEDFFAREQRELARIITIAIHNIEHAVDNRNLYLRSARCMQVNTALQ